MEEQVLEGRYITYKNTLRDFLIETYGHGNFQITAVDGGERWSIRVPQGRTLNAIQKREIQRRSQRAIQQDREAELEQQRNEDEGQE